MLLTSALGYPEVCGDYVDETTALIKDLTPCELGLMVTWLARIGADALVAKHGGERTLVSEELQATARTLLEAQRTDVGEPA